MIFALPDGFRRRCKIWDCVDENQVKEFLYENGPLIAALNGDYLKSYTGHLKH